MALWLTALHVSAALTVAQPSANIRGRVVVLEAAGDAPASLAARLNREMTAAFAAKNIQVVAGDAVRTLIGVDREPALLECKDNAACVSDLIDAKDVAVVVQPALVKVDRKRWLLTAFSSARQKGLEPLDAGTFVDGTADLPAAVRTTVARAYGWTEQAKHCKRSVRSADGKPRRFFVAGFAQRGADVSDTAALTDFTKRALGFDNDINDVVNQGGKQAAVGEGLKDRLINPTCKADCIQTIKSVVDSDYVVYGQVGGARNTYLVDLRILDQKSAENKAMYTCALAFRGASTQLSEPLRVALFKSGSLGTDPDARGSIFVRSEIADVDLFINGQKVDRLKNDMGKKFYYPTGLHAIKLAKEGYEAFDTEIRLQEFETQNVLAVMKKKKAFYDRWWFWTVVGAVAVAGAVTPIVVTSLTPDTGDGEAIIR